MRELAYTVARGKNLIMSKMYCLQEEIEKIFTESGSYPLAKETNEMSNKIAKGFRTIGEKILPANVVDMTIKSAMDKWKIEKKAVFYNREKSLPSFKKNTPIPFRRNLESVQLEQIKNEYFITLHLKPKNLFPPHHVTFLLASKHIENGVKTILDKLVLGRVLEKEIAKILDAAKARKQSENPNVSAKEIGKMIVWEEEIPGDIQKQYNSAYRLGSPMLKYESKKKKWFVIVPYEQRVKEAIKLNQEKILGVDLGIKNAFMASIIGTKKRLYPSDSMQIIRFKWATEKRRKEISRQYKVSRRQGHGRKHQQAPKEKISEKIANFRKSKYDLYTKVIIDFAIRNGCGVIQIEDLQDIIEENKEKTRGILSDWAISEFWTLLENKANEAGITIKKIAPQYTSKRCSRCGYISRENRKTQAGFRCVNCRYTCNADYNASQNISISEIDKIIEKQLTTGELVDVAIMKDRENKREEEKKEEREGQINFLEEVKDVVEG
jgi:IS605 OrfB family transposase